MKKIFTPVIFLFIINNLSAQIQRIKPGNIKVDSTNNNKNIAPQINKGKQMMQSLNLTPDQKIKIKALRQALQAKKEIIENDNTLTDVQKKTKIRELQRENRQNIASILTREQREKWVAMQQENKMMQTNEQINQ